MFEAADMSEIHGSSQGAIYIYHSPPTKPQKLLGEDIWNPGETKNGKQTSMFKLTSHQVVRTEERLNSSS